MLPVNLKIAFRHLQKNKTFTLIKFTGLSVGILGCLLIGLYVQYELSYDHMHTRADRIVRTTMEIHSGGTTRIVNRTGNMVGPVLASSFPEIESGVRVIRYDQVPVRYLDKLFEESNFFYADSTFFDIFSFTLLEGNAATALSQPNHLVLTESVAAKYFGHENPLGKVLFVRDQEFTVSGILSDPPPNTQLKPGLVASFVSLRDAAPERATWWNANYTTYFLLHQSGDRDKLESKIKPFMQTRSGETGMDGDNYVTYHFEPLLDVHLHSPVEGSFEPNGDIRYLYLLITVGLLILLIGVTTYVNLTTAAGIERSREIGVQKVLGAGKWQLLHQHLGEAGLLTGISILIGLATTPPLLPFFNRLFNRSLTGAQLLNPGWLMGLLVLGILITLLAGAWPAWVAARLKPVEALKTGHSGTSHSAGGIRLRKALISFQFGISVFLLICTFILQGQMNFIKHKNLGYDKDHVLVLPTDRRIIDKLDAFKSEFRQDPSVQTVSLSYETPTQIDGGYSIARTVTGEDSRQVRALPADQDLLPALNIQLAAGSNLEQQDMAEVQRMYTGDTTVVRSILVNEKQAADLGYTPQEAVLKSVNFNGTVCRIKGVFRDFHFASLHEPIENLVIFPDTWGEVLLVKISGKDIPRTLEILGQKWKSLAPHRPFTYHFLDEEFDAMYEAEIQSAQLVTTGCILAIFLACLGLLGLAIYSIVQRTKEIGIRKILGASSTSIVGLLSKDFLSLVLIGLTVASPVAWYVMHTWLQDFNYRIQIEWWVFVLSGFLTVGIAFLTIGFQSLRAALANPVEALRGE